MVSRRFLGLLAVLLIVAGLGLPLAATTTTASDRHDRSGRDSHHRRGDRAGRFRRVVTVPIETQPDWTYRFFIPALLVIAALVVIATVVRYFTNVVRKRYRVVRVTGSHWGLAVPVAARVAGTYPLAETYHFTQMQGQMPDLFRARRRWWPPETGLSTPGAPRCGW